MKTEFEQPANSASDGIGQTKCRRIWSTAAAGFGLGITAATMYLLLGGEYVWNIPRVPLVAFYPGFVAGRLVYDWGDRVGPAKVAGVLAVGLTYAVVAAVARFAWLALTRNK